MCYKTMCYSRAIRGIRKESRNAALIEEVNECLPAARLGACCFLRGIFLNVVLGDAVHYCAQVKSECGLR